MANQFEGQYEGFTLFLETQPEYGTWKVTCPDGNWFGGFKSRLRARIYATHVLGAKDVKVMLPDPPAEVRI